jgi:hypothetical protein
MHTLLAVLTAAAVWSWLMLHQIVTYYVFSVLIEQLPPPDAKSGKFYSYVYGVIQIFAANWQRTKDAVKTATTPKP